MTRPKVTINCVADHYADQNRERIVEFYDRECRAGGLISFRRTNGNLQVSLYNMDDNVQVVVDPNFLYPKSG